MPNSILKDCLNEWFIKAQGYKDDPWVQFIIYWLIFDAYITQGSGSGNDTDKLQWFYSNNNEIKQIVEKMCHEAEYETHLKELQKMCPVNDMRPNSNSLGKTINDLTNIAEIFQVIYQIRCNLFHGSKDIMSPRDYDLVSCSNKLLDPIMREWLTSKSTQNS